MIIVPPLITRAFIQSHKDSAVFIYGDTRGHNGDGKQASIARGEPNTYPIMVKYAKCANEPSSYLRDELLEESWTQWHRDLERLPTRLPIIVFPKIGRGWNLMHEKCPVSYETLKEVIKWYADDMLVNPEALDII